MSQARRDIETISKATTPYNDAIPNWTFRNNKNPSNFN